MKGFLQHQGDWVIDGTNARMRQVLTGRGRHSSRPGQVSWKCLKKRHCECAKLDCGCDCHRRATEGPDTKREK